MPIKKKTARQAYRRRSQQQKNSNWLKSTVLAGGALSLIVAFGYRVISGSDQIQADAQGCYGTLDEQKATIVWWDVSTQWSVSQTNDIKLAIKQAYKTLHFNETFSLITTDAQTVGDLTHATVRLCGGAKSSTDYARHNIDKTASPTFLKKQADKRFMAQVKPAIEKVFQKTDEKGGILAVDSPLLEQFQALSRHPEMRESTGRKRLILITDGIQNSEIARFCRVKNALPSFQNFKNKAAFRRVKPHAMTGLSVSLYLVLHPEHGPYCTEDELREFWEAYFKNSGAASFETYRLRPSGK